MRTAAYLRYSSDMQRAASLDDQARNIRTYCARAGLPEPQIYSDAAMSGSRDDRPGYQQLLAAASARAFDVLLVDDLTRLSRNSAETSTVLRRFAFHGIRLIGVSDGTDTAREGHELETGIKAVIGEHYLRDLAKKTHRGLTGRALDGASAGGLPYGYRVTATGHRAIDEAQADIVRRIFREFADGASPRQIAATLNAHGVPTARGGAWHMSSIYGDTRRGIGILTNPIYVGRQIWNRSKWVKHPDKKGRTRVERPESEWITTEQPELAIVPRDLWDAAQQRLQATRAKTQTALASGRKRGGGGVSRYLLSGLLKCGDCGAPMVIVDYYRYGCSAARDRGAAVCASTIKVARASVEHALLGTLKQLLLSDTASREFERQVRAALRDAGPDLARIRQRIHDAKAERDNIMSAIRAGIITTTTKAALLAAEAAITTAEAELHTAQSWQPAQILPRIRDTWRRTVEALESTDCIEHARAAVRECVGDHIAITQEAGTLYASVPASEAKLTVVAGACYVRQLEQALRIPIPHQTDRNYSG